MLYLTSNRRAVRFLQNQFKKQFGIFALEDWLQYCLEKTTAEGAVFLTAQQSFAIWFDLVKTHETALPPVRLAKELMKAYGLCKRFLIPITSADFAYSPDPFFFSELAQQFESLCIQNKWIDKSQVFEHCLQLFPKMPLPSHVAFYGFDEFTPVVNQVFSALQKLGVQCEERNDKCEAVIVGFKAKTLRDELIQVFADAAQVYRKKTNRIGIVITDLSNHLDFVQTLSAQQWPHDLAPQESPIYNISLSKTLIEFPLIQESAFYITPHFEYERDVVLSFIHGMAAREDNPHSLYSLARLLAQKASAAIPIKSLRALAEAAEARAFIALLDLHVSLQALMKLNQKPSEWLAVWADVWLKAGWSPVGWVSAYPRVTHHGADGSKILSKWTEVTTQFAAMDAVLGEVDAGNARQLFRHLLSEARLDESAHQAPIQIMGELESAGLSFDTLFITGLIESKWPREQSPTKFIPLSVQKKRQLPHSSAERSLNFAKTRLTHLLQSAAHITVSFYSTESGLPILPSALIPRHVHFDERQAALPSHAEPRHIGRSENYVPTRSPHVKRIIKKLEDMALCPFRAFAKHELNLESLSWYEVGVSPRLHGQLVHKTLEIIWQDLKSQDSLLKIDLNLLDQKIARAISFSIKKEPDFALLDPVLQAVEVSVLKNLIGEHLKTEKNRKPFSVQNSEEKIKGQLGPYDFELRLDRLDMTPEGGVLIDYKTSANFLSQYAFRALPYLQLNLYASAKAKIADAVYQVVERQAIEQNKTWISFNDFKNPYYENPAETLAQYQTLLDCYASGEQAVNPMHPNVCQDCDLQAVCRIRES